MMPLFSIVIPVMNSRLSLGMVFRCLSLQTFPREQFECLVVDDGSTDGTAEFLRRYRADFNLRPLFHPVNLGRSQARNTACREAQGEIIIFLDADMLTEPGWLTAYQDAFADGTLDVASGERWHLNLGAKNDDRLQALTQLADVPPEALLLKEIDAQFEHFRQQASISMYPTRAMQKFETQLPEVCRQFPESLLCAYAFISSNVAVRRSVFEKTSGYDPGIRRVHDTELGIRLWELGAKIAFAPGARAYHLYYSGQGDRDDTLLERLAVFYRHPYRLSILLNLWFAYHEQAAPQYATPAFENLLTLAAADAPHFDLDLPREFQRVYGQPLPVECVCSRDFMLEYYAETSGIAPQEMAPYLDLAVARGLMVEQRNGQIFFDFYHTTNWLRKCTLFQEHELIHTRFLRLYHIQKGFFPPAPAPLAVGAAPKSFAEYGQWKRNPLTVACSGSYQVQIPLRWLPNGPGEATLNIPLPQIHINQRNLQITEYSPAHLAEYLDAPHAILRDVPLRLAPLENEMLTLRYTFTCDLREHRPASTRPAPEAASALTAFLRPTYPATQLPKAQAVLKKIFQGPVSDTFAAARMIYYWILENTLYLQSAQSDYAILDTRSGPCVHQARLFVNLCRLMRIPAREQCGLMFGRSLPADAGERVLTADRGHTLFNHTWAEFYTPTRGWVPADFSAGLGKRILTAVNVLDPALRAEASQNSQAYDDYYFGHIDPFRLYASAQINKLITCPVVPGLEREAMKRLILETRHRLICDFTILEG